MQRSTQSIFDLADRGVIKLPAEITAARETAAAVNALDADPAPAEHPADLLDRLATETVKAAATGAPVDYTEPRRAREAAETDMVRMQSIRGAQDRATAAVDTAVRGHAEQLVRLMQGPFDRTVAELKAALKVAAQWPDEAAALGAPAKVRATLASRFVLRDELTALSAARQALRGVGYRSERDINDEFALLRDMNTLWPRESRQTAKPPWGDGDILEWALLNGAEVWLPTAAEQTARYDECFLAAEQEYQRRTSHARAVAGSFVGGGEPRYAAATDRPVRPAPRPAAVNAGERLFGKPTDTADTMVESP